MKISLTNFGPIENAELELGDITLVIGPNASGKSFLAYLLYVLSNLTRSYVKINDIDIKSIISQANGEIKIGNQEDKVLEKIGSYIVKEFNERLKNTFGVRLNKLISYGKESSGIKIENEDGILRFTLEQDNIRISIYLKRDIVIKYKVIKQEGQEVSASSITISPNETVLNIGASSEVDIERMIAYGILQTIKFKLLGELSRSSTIIPAERASIMANLRGYLKSYLLGKSREDKPVVRIFLSDLLSSMKSSKLGKIPVNEKVTYKIKESEFGIPKLVIEESENKVPLKLLSSGYAQLLPIDILSKNYHYLIIEEPELNLHADGQMEMGNYLFNLARSGKKVFVTTHSDFLTIQLAHVVTNYNKSAEKKIIYKPYFLYKGKLKELKVSEIGEIEEIPTIAEIIKKQYSDIYGS